MNETVLTRETLLEGIESLASSVENIIVLRRVWKILDREYSVAASRRMVTVPHLRRALRFYARNLSPENLRLTIEFIHNLDRS